MNTNDTPIAHRVVARFKAAAPRGKAQTAIMDYLNSHDGGRCLSRKSPKPPHSEAATSEISNRRLRP